MKWAASSVSVFLLAFAAAAASQEDIWKIYREGNAARAARLGVEAIELQPDDIDLRQVTGRALVDSGQFAAALPHLERVVALDSRRSWQSAWALAYAGHAHFGLGDGTNAARAFSESLALRATRNVISFAERAQMLFGLATNYSGWTRLETPHFRFYFSPDTTGFDPGRFAEAHEVAFTNINRFFAAELPKRIDFFVWRASEEAQRAGLGTLGFARPAFCLVHAAQNQTVGHEMTHVLCYQGLKPLAQTGLINEGLAVYFDQTRRDRLATARRAVQAAGLEEIALTDLWAALRAQPDGITYPVAGAFIERLRQKGGDEKLKALGREQTHEAARRIYGPELETWIKEFEADLTRPE